MNKNYGVCDICGKEDYLFKKYYEYNISSDDEQIHREVVKFCKNCKPKEPEILHLKINNEICHIESNKIYKLLFTQMSQLAKYANTNNNIGLIYMARVIIMEDTILKGEQLVSNMHKDEVFAKIDNLLIFERKENEVKDINNKTIKYKCATDFNMYLFNPDEAMQKCIKSYNYTLLDNNLLAKIDKE